MHKQIRLSCRVLYHLRVGAIISDLVWSQGGINLAGESFDDSFRLEIHAEPEILAHVTAQADSELGFLRVGGGAVVCGLGGFGDFGRVAVGNEGAVGGDGGDDVVYYPSGVLEGTGGGNGLETAGQGVGEEVPPLLKRCRCAACGVRKAGRRL